MLLNLVFLLSLMKIKCNLCSRKPLGVIQRLAFRFKAGKNGYESFRKRGYPLPSYRTLCRKIESIEIRPGIQSEILEIRSYDRPSNEEEKACILLIDEIEIKPGFTYDQQQKCFLGSISTEFQNKLIRLTTSSKKSSVELAATHILVFLVKHIYTKSKFIAAYYLTGNSMSNKSYYSTTKDVIKAIETMIKYKIHSVTTDIEPNNLKLWKEFGIESKRNSIQTFASHPNDSNRNLYFIADVAHLIKNLRNSLLSQDYKESDEIKQKYSLNSDLISFKYIRSLVETEKGREIKAQHKLTENHINIPHFKKMNVALAAHVFSKNTSASIRLIHECDIVGDGTLSTALFIDIFSDCWNVLNANKNSEYILDETDRNFLRNINILQTTSNFLHGINSVKDTKWKPIQAGFKLTINSLISLQEYLSKRGIKKIIPNKHTCDAIESFFSQIRSQNNPHPIHTSQLKISYTSTSIHL